MTKLALYVPLEAKPGREEAVAEFLRSALPLVDAEPGAWPTPPLAPITKAEYPGANDVSSLPAIERTPFT